MFKKRNIIISALLLVLVIVYTILVKNVDIAPIGPEGSAVGFSTLNGMVHSFIGVNMTWYNITNYLGLLPFISVAYFAIIGFKQLIKEKSLAKVDKRLIFLGIFYALFAAIYLFFEKVIINYRPVLIGSQLEASYPSSHTLLAICICLSTVFMIKYYIQNEKIRKIIKILLVILMITIVVGRILSGVHWASDIIGGIIISAFLLSLLENWIE